MSDQMELFPADPPNQPRKADKPEVEEVILEEVDATDPAAEVIVTGSNIQYPKGSQVRVKNFPPPVDPRNGFNWNGLVGTVTGHFRDPSGLIFYDVTFDSVQVPFARLNQQTGKLQRGYTKQKAYQRFDDTFLERA